MMSCDGNNVSSLMMWTALVMAGLLPGARAVNFTTVITASGDEYYVADEPADKATAAAACSDAGMALVAFSTSDQFQELMDAIGPATPYGSTEFWVNIIVVTSTDGEKEYFYANDDVSDSDWFVGEPTETCVGGTCCYSFENAGVSSNSGIRDLACTLSRNYICCYCFFNDSSTTTSATTSTSTTVTTSTATTATPTAATSTTEAITTTTTAAAVPTTTLTTTTTATLTTTAAAATIATTEVLALSTGQQMSIIYLALIIGTSVGVSCVCAGFWLVVNRKCRRKLPASEKNKKELEMTDCNSSDSD